MTEAETIKEKKLAVGRNPYPEGSDRDIEVISFEELGERFPSLDGIRDSAYRSDRSDDLHGLREEGFKPLAWTPNIRYLFYHPDKDLMVKDVEGDLFVYVNPSEETIREEVEQYPKAEVSLGEKFDSRFEREEL